MTNGRLVNLFRANGRLTEALDLAGQQIRHTRQADLGPWTRLAAQAWQLQILGAMGQASHVLAEVTRLRGDLDFPLARSLSFPAPAAAALSRRWRAGHRNRV